MRHRLIAMIVGTIGLAVVAGPDGGMAQGVQERRFAIAAQPLDEALTAFATTTGLQLLYDAALAAGRTSSRVEGRLEPRAALTRLLNGTGLAARFTSAGAVVIYAGAPSGAVTLSPITAVAAPIVGRPGVDPAARRYVEVVQQHVVQALGEDPVLSRRDYVVGVSLWIGEGGEAGRVKMLNGSGDAAWDAGFIAFMSGLRFDRPPPALPQPMRLEFRVRRRG